VLRWTGDREAYFWATHAGAELDLLVLRNGKRIGFEFKHSDAPTLTKSMHIALNDLKLQRLFVLYPGDQSYQLHQKVEVVSVQSLPAAQVQTDSTLKSLKEFAPARRFLSKCEP